MVLRFKNTQHERPKLPLKIISVTDKIRAITVLAHHPLSFSHFVPTRGIPCKDSVGILLRSHFPIKVTNISPYKTDPKS